MKYAIFALALLVLMHSVLAFAGEVDVTPELGYYAPLNNQVDEGDGAVTATHASALGFGARLTFWVNPNFAIEMNGLYTPTEMEGQAFGETGSLDASVFFGAARAVVGFGSDARFMLSGGLGFQSSSYDFIEGGTWMIGVIGAGVMIPMGEKAALRLGVDDYLYNAQWEVGDFVTEEIFQHDLVWTAGVTIRTGLE
jgi:hypothetical protein